MCTCMQNMRVQQYGCCVVVYMLTQMALSPQWQWPHTTSGISQACSQAHCLEWSTYLHTYYCFFALHVLIIMGCAHMNMSFWRCPTRTCHTPYIVRYIHVCIYVHTSFVFCVGTSKGAPVLIHHTAWNIKTVLHESVVEMSNTAWGIHDFTLHVFSAITTHHKSST